MIGVARGSVQLCSSVRWLVGEVLVQRRAVLLAPGGERVREHDEHPGEDGVM